MIIPRLPSRLTWHLDASDSKALEDAKKDLDERVEDLELVVLRFNDFGKDFIKEQKMSPDGFIQLALQLAYYKCELSKCFTSSLVTDRHVEKKRNNNFLVLALSEGLK